ncbi:MAG: hypothetical protein U1F45_20625 [Burkholderiales bacterium]
MTGAVVELEQRRDVGEREAERLRALDEAQAVDEVRRIAALPAEGAHPAGVPSSRRR